MTEIEVLTDRVREFVKSAHKEIEVKVSYLKAGRTSSAKAWRVSRWTTSLR